MVALMFAVGFFVGISLGFLMGIILMAILVSGKSEENLIARIERDHARRRMD